MLRLSGGSAFLRRGGAARLCWFYAARRDCRGWELRPPHPLPRSSEADRAASRAPEHLADAREPSGAPQTCAPGNCNVGLLAYSPLAGGGLSGKYITTKSEKSRFNIFPGAGSPAPACAHSAPPVRPLAAVSG